MRILSALLFAVTIGTASAQDKNVGYIPQGRDVSTAADLQRGRHLGAALYGAGMLAGGYFLQTQTGGKRDAGYLFMGAGCIGGLSMVIGSDIGERKRKKQDARTGLVH